MIVVWKAMAAVVYYDQSLGRPISKQKLANSRIQLQLAGVARRYLEVFYRVPEVILEQFPKLVSFLFIVSFLTYFPVDFEDCDTVG